MTNVLVVDDERSMREFLQILLERDGHSVTTADCVQAGLRASREERFDLVFVDLRLPDGSGMDVLQVVRDEDPDVQVIMMTAYATTENAVAAMRLGAYDYQMKPFKVEEVRAITQKALEKVTLLRENRELKSKLESETGLSRIVGRSPKMRAVVALIKKVAQTKTSVLIEGESGSGKELVARAIHDSGPRASQPFVAVNCGAIPEALIESELFGHAAGAFTGANRPREGLFRAADHGTLMLDEVSELPLQMQVKLLRVLEERAVRRVGEERETPIDTRIIASTNRDLQAMVREGAFREDLFYRLNVVRLRLPPLRERVEDVPLLARAFVIKYAEENQKAIDDIDPDVMRALNEYCFPGNVRELENCIERAVALATGPSITLSDLPEEMLGHTGGARNNLLAFPEDGIDLEGSIRAIERHFIQTALNRSQGVKKRAADMLGLTFRSFRYRLQKLDLDTDGDAIEHSASDDGE